MASAYEHFDPEWYLEDNYSQMHGSEEWWLTFLLDALHDFFHYEAEIGDVLLDVGSGPCFYSVVSACEKVKEIHLSDVLAVNRNILLEWKQKKRELHPKITDYLMQKIGLKKSKSEFLEELRYKVKSILHIDVTKFNPIEPKEHIYDVITSMFCLDAAVYTVIEFEMVVKNISSLLKINGYVCAAFMTQETHYYLKDIYYKSLDITPQEIQDIFIKNGFELCQFRYKYTNHKDTSSDAKGVFLLMARKIR